MDYRFEHCMRIGICSWYVTINSQFQFLQVQTFILSLIFFLAVVNALIVSYTSLDLMYFFLSFFSFLFSSFSFFSFIFSSSLRHFPFFKFVIDISFIAFLRSLSIQKDS